MEPVLSATNETTLISLDKKIQLGDKSYTLHFFAKGCSSHKTNARIKKSLENFAKQTLKYCSQSSQTSTLLANVLNEGDIRIEFHWPMSDQLAHWDSQSRSIRIFNDTLVIPSNNFSSNFNRFIFELCNADNPYFKPDTDESKLFNLKNLPNADAYAKFMEIAEYAGTLAPYLELFQKAQQENIWPGIKCQHEKLSSFDKVWKYTNKKSHGRKVSHTKRYKQQFKLFEQQQSNDSSADNDNNPLEPGK